MIPDDSDFKTPNSIFLLRLCPKLRWGVYSTPPILPAIFKGHTSKGKRRVKARKEKEGEKGRKGKGIGK